MVLLPPRSNSYRLERPSCLVGIAPTEEPHLFTAHSQRTDMHRTYGSASPTKLLSVDIDHQLILSSDQRRWSTGQLLSAS
jgi:hypothetical protein